jgi:hypothetical protein
MTEQDAMRVAERAEGLYHRAIQYAAEKKHSAELRFRAERDANVLGAVLGKTSLDVQMDIEGISIKEVQS